LVLGAGVLVWVPLALGAFGALGVTSVRVAVAALVVPVVPDLIAVARAATRATARISPRAGWMLPWLFALLPALAVAFLSAMTPTIDPDGLSYHLTAPKRWLLGGSLAYLPTYPVSNAPMGAEMLFMIALAFAGDAAAKLLHFVLGCAGALGVYLAGRRVRGAVTGALASTRYLVGPAGIVTLLGTAYVEGAVSCALIAASLAWMIWLRERDDGWLRVTALLAGLAVSFKLTAVVFPVALALLTMLAAAGESRLDRCTLGSSVKLLAVFMPFVLIPLLPWLVRSTILTGNPVFPMFASAIPSRDLSPQHAAQFEQYIRYMNWAGSSGALLNLAQRKAILTGVELIIAAIGAAFFVRARTRFARGTVVVLTGVTLVQCLAAGLYVRYWIPVLAVLQLPLLAMLEPLFVARGIKAALVGATFAGSLLSVRMPLSQTSMPELVKTALGVESQQAFVAHQMPLFPLYDLVNRATPEDAGVLLSNYCGGFYLDRRTFCAEFVQDSLRYDSWEHFIEDMHRLGVTHVIAPRTLATGGPLPDLEFGNIAVIIRPSEFVVLGRLLRSHGKLLEQALDQGLYEVTLPDLPENAAAQR
jgi:hypothetical protein